MKSLLFLLFLFPLYSFADCTLRLQITGAIGPGTLDYLERGLTKARDTKCASLFLEINTPGGNLQTTRDIVEKILASPIPILCLVTPSGGHAGSAGAIILQACHVNGALEATNIGAATPISSFGEDIYKDLRKKMIEDTQSWVEGLANFHGRNAKLAGELVSQAKALDARSAFEQKLIDQVVYRDVDFLKFAEGRKVKLQGGEEAIVQVQGLRDFNQDLRYKTLEFITDPQWSYIMFMASIGLLYFEVTHPGMVAPGVIGGIGLIVSLISFQKLDVYWGGVALIFLGIGLLVAELFITSFGLLGIGGAVALVMGSLFLFDFEKTGIHLPLMLVMSTSLFLLTVVLGLSYIALKTLRMPRNKGGTGRLIGAEALVVGLENQNGRQGWVSVQGENWKFTASSTLEMGDRVLIEEVEGLHLKVKRFSQES
jgi:membrane-bound serine protease (ClpP class)